MILKKIKIVEERQFRDESIQLNIAENIEIKCEYKAVFGMGERYDSINHKNQKILNKVDEVFCKQGEKTYFPLPFFLLDNEYAIFIDSKQMMSFSFKDIIQVENFDKRNDSIYIFKGSYKECIADFLQVTGTQKKAPKWTFGTWISAHRWNSEEIVKDVQKKLKEYDIPVSVMVLEQWSDEATFYIFNGASYPEKEYLEYDDFSFTNSPWKNPKKMIESLHEDGIRLLLWQAPVVKGIPEDEPFNARHDKEESKVREKGYVVTGEDSAYQITDGNWFSKSMIPDFSNPEANEWWFGNRQYLLDIGVDGFKTDGGEFIHDEVKNFAGESRAELTNNYSLEYAKAYDEFLGPDRVAFSRAGYIGQQQYALQWAGDQKSTFEELQAVYRAGINASLCGQINWGFDIAGFSGELPSRELYYRANQLAVFSPIMQVHSEPVGGQFSAIDPIREFNNERTIWNVGRDDEKLFRDIRALYVLRMNLLPYIYSEYLKAIEDGTTLMKHMNIECDGEYSEEQFMFGNLLVAPVLYESKDIKDNLEILLPEGTFYNIFTNKKHRGKIQVNLLKLEDMFVFIKNGNALVTKKADLKPSTINNGMDIDKLYFRLYGEKGRYRYVDEKNDFVISWNKDEVLIDGSKNVDIDWIIIL
jgi:alpha-D-xyloside xylohydrolase